MAEDLPPDPTEIPEEVLLPSPPILDAGIRKFREMANLHWPGGKDGYKSVSFDTRDNVMLRITIGLVYMAMAEAEKAAKDAVKEAQARAETAAHESSAVPPQAVP